MGMYDTVRVMCPECGARIEYQSKAGECSLGRYHVSSVPVEIANDLAGHISACPKCEQTFRLLAGSPITHVKMYLVKEE